MIFLGARGTKGPPPKAGVIYEKDLITYDGEKIFLDGQGVTPDFHTKQAEKIFLTNPRIFWHSIKDSTPHPKIAKNIFHREIYVTPRKSQSMLLKSKYTVGLLKHSLRKSLFFHE